MAREAGGEVRAERELVMPGIQMGTQSTGFEQADQAQAADPAGETMELVPVERELLMEARLSTADVGHMRLGLNVDEQGPPGHYNFSTPAGCPRRSR